MFAAVLDIDKDLYRRLTEDRMLGWKLDAFKEVVLTKLRPKRHRRRFAEIMDELKGLNRERSTAVHGEWLPGGTGITIAEMFGIKPVRPAVAKHSRLGSKRISELKAERLEGLVGRLELGKAALCDFFMKHHIEPKLRRARKRSAGKPS
jgi:hypothetical protein